MEIRIINPNKPAAWKLFAMSSQPSSQVRVRLGKLMVAAPANPLGAVVLLVVVLSVLIAAMVIALAAGVAVTHLIQLI